MSAAIYAISGPSVTPEIANLHEQHVQRHTTYPYYRYAGGHSYAGHGKAIDDILDKAAVDVVVLLEPDTAIVGGKPIETLVAMAEHGVLAGLATCANHTKGMHVVAGPCCCAIPRQRWLELGRPSALYTDWIDTLGDFTLQWQAQGWPVFFSMPVKASRLLWQVGRTGYRFGPDCYYDIGIYHRFGMGSNETLKRLLLA